MAEKSFFFTAVGGAPAYTADDFVAWLYDRLFRKDGVLFGLDNSLAVTSDGTGNALIATGCASKTGHGYKNDSVLTKALTLPTAGYTNINTLVVRVDSSTSPNTMHVVVLVGTSVSIGNTPAAPSITSGSDVYLADIQVTNTAGTYSYIVTDKRAFAPTIVDSGNVGAWAYQYFSLATQSAYANKLLTDIKTVDGAGSGLDADLLDGMTSDAIVKPLSDLNRVVQITGDGVPMFPDNVAGRTYWQDDWATTDGWTASGGTASVSGGNLLMTYSGTSGAILRNFTSFTGKIIRIKLKTNVSKFVTLYGTVGGVANTTIQRITAVAGIATTLDTYVAGEVAQLYVAINSPVSGDILYIDTIYIGSGLYDTPIYDKACCNRATNNGALPVPASRGLGLQFLGAGSHPIVFNGPIIGVTGTIRIKFKTLAGFTDGNFFGNRSSTSGLSMYVTSTGIAFFIVSTAGGSLTQYALGTLSASTEYAISFYFTLTTLYVYKNGALVYTHALTASIIQTVANLYIGRDALNTTGEDFTLYSFEYVAEAETLDSHIRFVNGDDAVDSQQKTQAGAPYALAVCDPDGQLSIKAKTAVLADNATNATNATSAAVASFAPVSTIVRLTSGTSWTVPAGVTKIKVLCVGGGGGGGGGQYPGGGVNATGAGGGAGTNINMAYADILSVTPGNNISYSIGAGGAGGIGTDSGAQGGNTTFTGATVGVGGLGGIGSGEISLGFSLGGAKGSGLGSCAGQSGSPSLCVATSGATPEPGVGGSGGGNGGAGASQYTVAQVGGYGGGGGGGAGKTNVNGAAGGPGIIIIEY